MQGKHITIDLLRKPEWLEKCYQINTNKKRSNTRNNIESVVAQ